MKYCDYVNTKQGSFSVHRFSNGNTLPLVQLPFGMAAFCPGKREFVKGKKQVKKAVILGKEFDADRFEKVIPYSEFE